MDRGGMECCFHCIQSDVRWFLSVPFLMLLILIPWISWPLPSFSTVKLFIFLSFLYSTFWKDITMHSPYSKRVWSYAAPHWGQRMYVNYLESFWTGDVFSPLFTYLIIYLQKYSHCAYLGKWNMAECFQWLNLDVGDKGDHHILSVFQ